MPNYTYTNSIPAGSDIPSQSQPDLQTNCTSVNSILNVDMYTFNDNNGGYHRKTTYVDQASNPGSSASQVVEFAKSTSGSSELFIQRDGVATAIQLTRGTPSVGANGYTFLPGGLLLQWGTVTTSGLGAATFTFPVAFSSAVYSVTATGSNASTASSKDFFARTTTPTTTSVDIITASSLNNRFASGTVYIMAIGV